MKPNIIFRKSNQLSIAEIQQFRYLFFRVFEKKMDEGLFGRKYLHTPKGYSYHGLMLHEKVIVGTFNAIPYRYKYFDREQIFALSVDTMIDPEHRGGGHLLKMANLVYEALIRDKVPLIFGFPNEYFYRHEKRVLGTRDIGELDYYLLPRNIGAVVPKMRLLNFLSRICARIIIGLPRIERPTEWKYKIEKTDSKEFVKHRYDDSYSTIELNNGAKCTYKICEENQKVRTLYIIDVLPLKPAAFAKAVKEVYKVAGRTMDIIIYVGKLPFKPALLIRVPESRKPQKIRMTGKILIPEVVDHSVFAIENWNVNISNFDVR